MIAPIDKALGEGNCVGATQGGKEAGTKTARLRTETSYKAGPAGRVSTTSRSRLASYQGQLVGQVKGEPRVSWLTGSENSCSYPGRPAWPTCVSVTLHPVRLA